MDLAQKKCVACEEGALPLTRLELETLLRKVPGWILSPDAKKISREFGFPDFTSALAFTDRVGALAEREGHHPDIRLSYGKVGVELWTHSVGGLSENDFILAAKVNALVS